VDVELVKVSFEQKGVLRNLLEFYLYELSVFLDDLELSRYGTFEYRTLDHYWTDGGRHPFFIVASGKLAGFVLVRELERLPDQTVVWLMAEFFVARKFQKRGIGRAAAIQAFDKFRGTWIVSQIESNAKARQFWENVISEYTNGAYVQTRLGNQPAQRFDNRLP